MGSAEYILTGLLLVTAVLYLRLWRRYRKNIRKVTFMFDAIDNVDYAFKFSTQGVGENERLLNSSLNRIKQILQDARDEAIAREQYYELIINQVDTGIMVVDEHGNVLQHNKAILHLLGTDVLTHIDRFKELLENRNLSKKETRTTLRGKPVRIIAVSDIRGEISNAELDSWTKLIRVLTHEIMNTVTPITSLSETILDKIQSGSSQQSDIAEGLQVINQTGKDLIHFVESYRRLTHLPQPSPSLFYVKPFVERMARLAEEQKNGKEIGLHVDVEPKDLIVYADEGLIAHVVTNIIKNAMQSIRQEGNVWIQAFCDEREAVIIHISNDGEPIPADVAAHIFVPFFTTKKEGSGVGLSLSQQIMRLSGGRLELLPETTNGKTTFRLIFP